MFTFTTKPNTDLNFKFINTSGTIIDNVKNCKLISLKSEGKELNKFKNKYDYVACNAKSVDDVSFWINKKIDFLINPFDDKKRYFDYNTINVIKQNKIIPVILLNRIENYNKVQTAYFLRNAFLLVKFCKKNKIPVIIDSGLDAERKTNERQELCNYALFGFTIEQGKMFNKIVFGD